MMQMTTPAPVPAMAVNRNCRSGWDLFCVTARTTARVKATAGHER
jgi:hypothetical protein